MKVCSDQRWCKDPNPQPLTNFNRRKGGHRAECKVCKAGRSREYYGEHREQTIARNKAYRARNAKVPDYRLTTVEERALEPEKCLAVDVLMIAVMDHNKGTCEPEFWYSEVYETLCDVAGFHPDYLRRGVNVTAPTQEETP